MRTFPVGSFNVRPLRRYQDAYPQKSNKELRADGNGVDPFIQAEVVESIA